VNFLRFVVSVANVPLLNFHGPEIVTVLFAQALVRYVCLWDTLYRQTAGANWLHTVLSTVNLCTA
jgi:hypothetical protein